VIELLLNAESQLALGLLDQAERTYRTVLEADPRNAIATIGLSRVALERSDEAGAHALARAALEIDPENATARRMIDRLEEVARYRDAMGGRDAAAPPDEGRDVTSTHGVAPQAMIRAFALAEATGDPMSGRAGVPGGPDDIPPKLAEASSMPPAPRPGGSGPRPGGSAPGRVHESSPHRHDPEPAPAPPAGQPPEPAPPALTAPTPPTAAANQAAPVRPRLLRRLLRRS